jgi:hypothetical protein
MYPAEGEWLMLRTNLVPHLRSEMWAPANMRVGIGSEPRSQKRDLGHPAPGIGRQSAHVG